MVNQRQRKKRNKAATAQLPPPNTPAPNPPKLSASGRPCDDELTLLAEGMRPSHLKFAQLYLEGKMGTKATLGAGFKDRKTGWALLRRDDVRRYIQLMQREAAVASRVSLSTLIDHLWRIVADPTIQQRRRDSAILQLSRILTAGTVRPSPESASQDPTGLDVSSVASIEARILGLDGGEKPP